MVKPQETLGLRSGCKKGLTMKFQLSTEKDFYNPDTDETEWYRLLGFEFDRLSGIYQDDFVDDNRIQIKHGCRPEIEFNSFDELIEFVYNTRHKRVCIRTEEKPYPELVIMDECYGSYCDNDSQDYKAEFIGIPKAQKKT
jgi:hypothetical protein